MPAMMIYVGNLDYATTSEELRALFEPFGAVAMAEVQVKARSGQSRGFGLVDMPRPAEAEAAIAALNGRDFKDRALTVNESQTPADGPRPLRRWWLVRRWPRRLSRIVTRLNFSIRSPLTAISFPHVVQ